MLKQNAFLNSLRPEEHMQYSNILNGFCGLGNDLWHPCGSSCGPFMGPKIHWTKSLWALHSAIDQEAALFKSVHFWG